MRTIYSPCKDEISRLVVQALGPPSVTVATRRAPNPKAYRLSLQARYHWNKWNPEDIKRSIALLDEALAIDPRYARAYAWLGSAYGVLGVLGGARRPKPRPNPGQQPKRPSISTPISRKGTWFWPA
jgi:hypothetical protein